MDVTLYFFDSSCYLDLEIAILCLKFEDFRLEVRNLRSVIDLLVV